MLPPWTAIDKLTVGQRDDITAEFANLFFRTGIPFIIARSDAMKDFIQQIRPAYVPFIPSPATIAGNM